MEQNDAGRDDISFPAPVMTSDVWPPPPTGGQPLTAVVVPLFVSVRRLSRAIIALLSGYVTLAVVSIASVFLPLPPVGRQTEDGILALLQGLLLVGTGICFLIWTYRLSKNLRAFGVEGLKYAPVWTIAYFLIPILSLYRPYQVFREIWQASDYGPAARTGQAWQNTRSPALLGFWWVSVIVMNILDALSSESASTSSIDMVDNAAGLLSTFFALQVVRLMTARQEKAARVLSLIT